MGQTLEVKGESNASNLSLVIAQPWALDVAS